MLRLGVVRLGAEAKRVCFKKKRLNENLLPKAVNVLVTTWVIINHIVTVPRIENSRSSFSFSYFIPQLACVPFSLNHPLAASEPSKYLLQTLSTIFTPGVFKVFTTLMRR